MSNSLADFDDDDVAGRLKVIDELEQIRELWKDCHYELNTGKKRREKASKPTQIKPGLNQAEVMKALATTRAKISQNRSKLDQQPDHKKAFEWQAEIDRLTGLKVAYEAELTRF